MRSFSLLFAVGTALAAHAVHADSNLVVRSTDMREQGTLATTQVYRGFGCEGGNQSPQISWSDAPPGAKSFAVTAYDPDAPTGSGWWHWVVYDIPANVRQLEAGTGSAGKLPGGARHGRNDYGTKDFGGACPPPGDPAHRYIFTVHALKVERLDVPADASPALIGYMLHANRLATASLTARYGR